jgi:hypothetical protein
MRLSRHPSVLCVPLVAGALLGCAPEPTHKTRDGGVTAGGTGGSAPLPATGGSGGSGGSGGAGGITGTGGSGGSGGSSGNPTTSDAAATNPSETTSRDAGAAGASTFVGLYNQIFSPGCTAANGACHSVLRSKYFLFASGEQMKSYMMIVPTPAKTGAMPQRVTTILNHVVPSNPADKTSVSMPPQTGKNLGTPPVRLPPLTPEQVNAIRAWGMSGAKYE